MSRFLKILFLLAGILMFSCQKDNPVEETEVLTVDPSEINASASLSSYAVDVESNTKWTVSVSGANGASASWVTLGRTSGSGNMQVTVRVTENKDNYARNASLLFQTKGGKTAEVILNQESKENADQQEKAFAICVGSYNLRMSHLDNGTDNAWSVRKDRLKKSILEAPFDVFGIQEVDDKTQAWLDSELSSKYAFRYFSPYSANGNGTRAQGIGYRADRYTLSDWHYFWATDTPDVMSTNDTGSSGNFNRGGCCCVLTHIATGTKVFVMNNHGCLNDQSNEDAAPVYVEQEKKYNKDGLPSFFVGDMNAKESGPVYKTYTAHWSDAYLAASKRTGASGTYNAFKNPGGSSRIDYVFFRGEGVTAESYHCENKLYDGFYPSDHFPIWVEFKIEK